MSSQKTVLITGCSSGIGNATAILLAEKGHNIIALNRESKKTDAAFKELTNTGEGKKFLYYSDLSVATSINEACEKILQRHKAIDILINNAGVFKTKKVLSDDKTEMTFSVNTRAAAMVCKYLMPAMKETKQPVVIFISSELYKSAKIDTKDIFNIGKYSSNKNYAHSKMLVTMLAEVLAEKIEGIRFYSMHPGVIGTDAFRDYPLIFTKLMKILLPKPAKGASSVAKIALEDMNEKSGTYFKETTPASIKKISGNDKIKAQLYNWYQSL